YQKKPDEAVAHLRIELRNGHRLALVYTALGDAHLQAGRLQQAMQWYRKAVDREPDMARHRISLAGLLERSGKTREAEDELEVACKRDEDWPSSAFKIAWQRATHPDRRARDGAQALKLAKRICEARSNEQALCLDALAAAYAELGRFEEAEA